MKKTSVITTMFLCLLLLATTVQAQRLADTGMHGEEIKPYHVAIGTTKTTNIIFPYAIISVDRGSQDVLAQKAKGVENILQIKAAKESFTQTNLTVITADGRLTSFLVDYDRQPSVLNLTVAANNKAPDKVLAIAPESINTAQVQYEASLAAASKQKITCVKDKRMGMRLRLTGLFIHDDLMYLRFNLVNRTDISYDIDQLRMYIRDEQTGKRTASQEITVTPVFSYNKPDKINGQSGNTFILVVPKFTIPDKKVLVVQVMEKNGGRHLQLLIKNKVILHASSAR